MFSWDWLFLVPVLLLRGRQGGIFSVTFGLDLVIPLHPVQKEKRSLNWKRMAYFILGMRDSCGLWVAWALASDCHLCTIGPVQGGTGGQQSTSASP